MLNIEKVKKGLYYLKYNGRFVESFDTLKEATYTKQLLNKSGLVPE